MKARNFRYIKPATLTQALRILADAGESAAPLAGGQSLLAGLNMRLSAPQLLVDINELAELRAQSYTNGVVRLGALTRHAELLTSELVRQHLPLFRKAAPHIGHIAVRNRGTLGGSLAYADPAAELPACALALDATLVLAGISGQRAVKAQDFFKGLFETDLHVGELIIAVDFPAAAPETQSAFGELSRRHGDFALVAVAAVMSMESGRIGGARLAYAGCADHAKIAKSVMAAVVGQKLPLHDSDFLAAAVRQDLSPYDTPGLRAETRLHMATVLTRRVINSCSKGTAS
jgi:aerobic carbon-monoxide dehydrogenase medium subunit